MIKMVFSNITRFQRTTAGICLIVAPLFFLISALLQTRGPNAMQDYLNAIALRQGANALSFVFSVYGFTLMIPAVAGIVHLLGRRAPVLSQIGGALTVFGFVSFAFVAGTEFLLVVGANPALIRETIIALNELVGRSVAYTLLNMTEIIGVFLGILILALALFRTHAIPRTIPAILALGIVLRFALASFYLGTILSELFVFLALAYIGFYVLKQSDEDWVEAHRAE